ncbi:hypothetical protein CSUI_000885, partial [Cystoisospora suis]
HCRIYYTWRFPRRSPGSSLRCHKRLLSNLPIPLPALPDSCTRHRAHGHTYRGNTRYRLSACRSVPCRLLCCAVFPRR